MSDDDRHVFRFFVTSVGAPGAFVTLDASDAEHARVVRMSAGDRADVVDADNVAWQARVVDADAMRLELVTQFDAAAHQHVSIDLIAGALVGGKFDELVDGAVQAGATSITPFVRTRRDAERLTSRQARLERIARSSAKQSKRHIVPYIHTPIDQAELLRREPGIVLDGAASLGLDVALGKVPASAGAPVRLLVGPADGLDRELVAQLVDAGWVAARLGPSILRAELAAAVAVAIAALPRDGDTYQ